MPKISKITGLSVEQAQEFVAKPENVKRFSEYETRIAENKAQKEKILSDFADVKAIFQQASSRQVKTMWHAKKLLLSTGMSEEQADKILANAQKAKSNK